MPTIEELQQQINDLQARNARVEKDKAWETSWTRRVLIATLTYGVVVLFFIAADLPRPFINASVPVLGFLFSTMTVGAIKKIWLRRR